MFSPSTVALPLFLISSAQEKGYYGVVSVRKLVCNVSTNDRNIQNYLQVKENRLVLQCTTFFFFFNYFARVVKHPEKSMYSIVLYHIHVTNRFHIAVRLFSNRSLMTSKCGKHKKSGHKSGTRGVAECVTDVPITWRRFL